MERDSRWVAAKDGHWYLLSTIFWCEVSECELGFGDPDHYCHFTLRARQRHSGMTREIEKDIHRLPAVGGEESAQRSKGNGGTASSDTSSWPFDNDPEFSRSSTFSPGNA